MTIELRPYQDEALDALAEAEARGQRRNLLSLATGLGKTIIFGTLVTRTRGRTLIMAHRDELISQAVDKLLQIDPMLYIGVVQAGRNDVDVRIVVSSVQTLARERRREQLFGGEPFARVIVDEAHHAAAVSYRDILDAAGVFAPDGPLLLGVTATPVRGDKVGLSDIFQEIVYERTILWGIQNGYLSDLSGKQILLDVDLDFVRTTAGDFADGSLGDALEEANAPHVIAASYLQYAAGRRTIVFTPTVHMALATMYALQQSGVAAEMVHGAMPMDERRGVLRRFHSGETAVVCNCAVLTEGFDEPAVDCIVIARPTKSAAFYQQMIGRGTRRFPGKDDCLVLDLVGNSDRHKLVTVSTLFGLPLSALKDGEGTVSAAIDEEEARQAAMGVNGARIRAKDVDLFGAARFHWVQTATGWILPGGGIDYAIVAGDAEEGAAWQLLALQRGERPRLIAEAPDMLMCMGQGEDLVRKAGAGSLAAIGAPWRQGPPSDKQIYALKKLGMPITDGMTKGEASDLLTVAFAAKRL